MTPKPFGDYYGSDISEQQAEILTIQHIPAKLLAEEADLMQRKWFDYRRMHPMKATYLFTAEYGRAYGRMVQITEDVSRGKFTRGMKQQDFLDSREKLSLWKLRQQIDRHGMRYEFYLRQAMDWCIDQGWRQPPRPSHLYSNADMTLEVLNEWEMEMRAKLQFPRDPHFLAENWVGAPDQIAYEKFLIERLKTRQQPRFALRAALYDMSALRIEAALEHFPQSVVGAAVDDCLADEQFLAL